MQFLDERHDYIEALRRFLWPKLHPLISPFGGYAVGTVSENQHVATLDIGEEPFEKTLSEIGFVRNPIACFKRHIDDGTVRLSEGSWVLFAEHDPLGHLGDEKQLHITLFGSSDGLDVYAHEEYDWRKEPIKHHAEVEFRPDEGVALMAQLLESETNLFD